MQLLFARKRTLGSLLIRLATWSRWSHVAVVDGDQVIDATFLHGVSCRSVPAFFEEYDEIELLEIPCPNDAAGLAWTRAQLGKPYDWTAIVGFIARRGWAEDDKWFCSELAEGAVAQAGRTRFRADLARITPQHAYMVMP